ncbi:MAG TPA: ATP-binding protein [Usitatibacter sp.]|nr:ATP-binding protein [Usitatibacter sp.]
MQSLAFPIAEASQVSSTRLALTRLARSLDFDETLEGRVALLVTEAVTNMVRHGGGGTFAARTLARNGSLGVEMLAIDNGPGMADFAASARDGVSTGGTAGTGLGAIGRLSDEFEVSTGEGRGTILRSVVWNRPPGEDDEHYQVGAVVVPKPGESVCGDAWGMVTDRDGATFLVADGLGHGEEASRAAASAVDVLHRNRGIDAIRLLDLVHSRLHATRGAAVAVIRHDRASGEVSFAGVGNIAASIHDGGSRRAMVSHNGIVGHNVHKSAEFRYPWPRGALLVAHSDGLESQWDLGALPDLAGSHPAVIAAALYRRHSRKRDDTAVLVVRRR